MRIVAILGSVTPPGRLSGAIEAALQRAAAAGHTTELVDLGQRRVDFADGRPPAEHDDASAAIIDLVTSADAVLLASPVYRGSMTGALKNLLDLLPVETLQGKPAGIVAMGATLHHYLGVEWHLRDVLTWFGAITAPTSVYLSSADFADGKPTDRAASSLDALIAALETLSNAAKNGNLGPPPIGGYRG